MTPKKVIKRNTKGSNNSKLLALKKFNLSKLTASPVNIIEGTKSKIGNYYLNFKKEKQKEKIRLEKKRKLDEKKNY